MCKFLIGIFILPILFVFGDYNVTNDDLKCFNYDTKCSLCIQEANCQWCTHKYEHAKNKSGHYCFSTNSDLSRICLFTENPRNSGPILIKNVNLTEFAEKNVKIDYDSIIQLKPQHIKLELRKGVPINFTLSYRQVKDYPLDLYYLMDLSRSMLEDKKTLASLGSVLARTMRRLTSQFKIGFGSFVDKVLPPYVNIHPDVLKSPCTDLKCAPPFSFKNNLRLTEKDEEFVRQVRAAQISSNLDSPEGGLDALMQAMVCDAQIGWRKNVRKIIIFSTDAIFHFAGDGKLGGVVEPNDGKCHLNADGFYDKYDEFDYPSIGQINDKAQEKGINVIFAVKGHSQLYEDLSHRIKNSAYGELSTRSDNVIKLVTDVYNNITSKVDIGVKSPTRDDPVSFRFFSDCGTNGEVVETSSCQNVKEGTSFDFTVEVTLANCPENGNENSRVVLGTLQDSVIVDIAFACHCECERKDHLGYEEKSAKCSSSGTRQCDVCECDENFYGKECQCSRERVSSDVENNQNKCRPEGSSAETSVCSGRGRCECETCLCWKERYHGKYCQCDKGMCQQHINSDKECSGNGVCDCNTCVCNPGWENQFCECRSKKSCLPKGEESELCSGNGDCHCGKCQCQVPHTGKYCEECPTCGEGKCLQFRPCVQCKVWNSGEFRGEKCDNCSYSNVPTVETIDAHLRQWALLCTFEDEQTGCDFNFTYKYTDDGYQIYAQSTQKCPEKIDILAVTFGVIGGIVAIGLLTLIFWKIATTIHDRREFLRFEQETKSVAWSAVGNPLYKDPTTTVANPAFSTK